LPALVDDAGVVPATVSAAVPAGEGAVLFASPQDQSSCDHLQSGPMSDSTEVTDGRCHFHEEYGDSHSWTLLDENLAAPVAGKYRFAVFTTTPSTAKLWFACCAWPEDFQTSYDMPEADCPYCGTKKSFTSFASLFYEQRTMAVHGGFPPLQDCALDPGPVEPTEEQCPDESSAGVARQPESCMLGCNDGDCHSHNIYGECTYELEWRVPHPMLNGANVTKMLLFKGDKVIFKKGGEFDHNLVDMKTATALENCDFADVNIETNEVGNVEEVRAGTLIEFMEERTHFYSCTFPNHCIMGQILTVDVKNAAEGLQCHKDHEEEDHGHDDHDHGHDHAGHEHVENPSSSSNPDCLPPMVTGRLIGTNARSYGANHGECAEFCTAPQAMAWMTGVVEATCADGSVLGGAYPEFVMSKEVLPNPASPPMTVHIHRKKLPCHCHSYEKIECNAPGTANALYDEHINEITEHCGGVLDGTITDCPYKCFQPFEVLHLHYMECSLRPKDALYSQIEATDLCHQASRPPAGTNCPEDEAATTDDDDGDDDVAEDDADESVAAVGLMLAVFFVQ
jgi:hypothetical protein